MALIHTVWVSTNTATHVETGNTYVLSRNVNEDPEELFDSSDEEGYAVYNVPEAGTYQVSCYFVLTNGASGRLYYDGPLAASYPELTVVNPNPLGDFSEEWRTLTGSVYISGPEKLYLKFDCTAGAPGPVGVRVEEEHIGMAPPLPPPPDVASLELGPPDSGVVRM